MDTDTLWRHVDAERAWLADLLESLDDDAWRHPSLCDAWTVRDVGAHLAMAQTPVRDHLGPAVRAGFRYDALIRDTAIRSALTRDEIVGTLRGFVGSRKRVAFITDAEPLIDILIHTQDVCRPLGIDHPIAPEPAAAAADRILSTPWPLRRWSPPTGVRLVATDTDWSYGSGTEQRAPMGEHLLAMTGRTSRPASGDATPHPVRTDAQEER